MTNIAAVSDQDSLNFRVTVLEQVLAAMKRARVLPDLAEQIDTADESIKTIEQQKTEAENKKKSLIT